MIFSGSGRRSYCTRDTRYYDVVRNGYWKTELQGNFSELSVDDVKDGALYMPVPQTAFSQNDLMIQNAFWASKMK